MNHYRLLLYPLVLIGLLFMISCSTFDKKSEDDNNFFYQKGVLIQKETHGNYFRSTITPLFLIYDKFISPIDNRKCIFTPTCSAYSRQAIQKYGFFQGYVLTFARITRCNPSVFIKNRYPRSKEKNIWKAYDPIK